MERGGDRRISEHLDRNSTPAAGAGLGPVPPAAGAGLGSVGRVAVGSTNPAKVEAARQALARLAPAAAVVGLDVDSGVGAQPHGDGATREGAERRAALARAALDADLGVGLEGGVVREGERTWLVSWAAVVDRAGRVGFAEARMLLPPATAPRLDAGEELGPIVDGLFGVSEAKTKSGAIGLLTRGLATRSDAFALLVVMALAPHLHPGLYAAGGDPG